MAGLLMARQCRVNRSAMDSYEARFGWHTHSRRCWALRGQRVVLAQEQRYEWEYVYGAVEVVAGLAGFQFLPSVSLALSGGFLQQLADSDVQAEHVVIWDQAGFHPRPGDAALPARIHLRPLPPDSPELNPVEGLWDQTPDVTCNRHFADLDHLEEALTNRKRWHQPNAPSPCPLPWWGRGGGRRPGAGMPDQATSCHWEMA